jgi:pentose-5-phosphate-3-epimerase
MYIIPSLLEYSTSQLSSRLNLIQNKYKIFQNITGQPKEVLDLHLDFVFPQFAKDRAVMTSLSLDTVLEELEQRFGNNQLILSLHLMGALEDLQSANQFLQTYTFNPIWRYHIFVEDKLIPTFRIHEMIFENVQLGIWYDPSDWATKNIQIPTQSISNYLLMTVIAGKSGQSKQPEISNKALEMATSHPKLDFIIDGGWSVDEISKIKATQNLTNLKIVSYSSFWQEIKSQST